MSESKEKSTGRKMNEAEKQGVIEKFISTIRFMKKV